MAYRGINKTNRFMAQPTKYNFKMRGLNKVLAVFFTQEKHSRNTSNEVFDKPTRNSNV